MTGAETETETGPGAGDAAARRDEWQGRLDALVAQVTAWVEPREWATRVIMKKMRDSDIGEYEAPALSMQKGPTRVLLDPIAQDAPRTEGVVDLYLMPAYDDIASLYFVDGDWQLHYEFRDAPEVNGIKQVEAMPLSERTFTRVLDEIAAHATPSF